MEPNSQLEWFHQFLAGQERESPPGPVLQTKSNECIYGRVSPYERTDRETKYRWYRDGKSVSIPKDSSLPESRAPQRHGTTPPDEHAP